MAMRFLLPTVLFLLSFVSLSSSGKDLFSQEEKETLSLLKSEKRFINLNQKNIILSSKHRIKGMLTRMSQIQSDVLKHQLRNGIVIYLDKIDQKITIDKHIKKFIFKGVTSDR